MAAQVRVDEPLAHLGDGFTQGFVGQTGLAIQRVKVRVRNTLLIKNHTT